LVLAIPLTIFEEKSYSNLRNWLQYSGLNDYWKGLLISWFQVQVLSGVPNVLIPPTFEVGAANMEKLPRLKERGHLARFSY